MLGQFRFQELAMDDDGRHATEIAKHVYCRRIAGNGSTPPSFAVAIPSPTRFDAEIHPSKRQTIPRGPDYDFQKKGSGRL